MLDASPYRFGSAMHILVSCAHQLVAGELSESEFERTVAMEQVRMHTDADLSEDRRRRGQGAGHTAGSVRAGSSSSDEDEGIQEKCKPKRRSSLPERVAALLGQVPATPPALLREQSDFERRAATSSALGDEPTSPPWQTRLLVASGA